MGQIYYKNPHQFVVSSISARRLFAATFGTLCPATILGRAFTPTLPPVNRTLNKEG